MKTLVLLAVTIPLAFAQSAWLPAAGHVVVTATYSNQQFQNIWRRSTPARLTSPVRQQTFSVLTEVGLSRRFAADVTAGYTLNRSSAFGGPRSDGGLTDSQFGIRWKMLDEQTSDSPYLPTLTFRAAGIVRGTYQPGVAFSAGDGASGAEFALATGKAFGRTRFGSFAEGGYRVRNQGVPADVFGTGGIYRAIGPVTLSGSYQFTNGLSGMNLGDPGIQYPLLKETMSAIQAGIGYTNRRGQSVQFFTASTLGGRNTGDAFIFGMSVSFHIARR